MDLRDYSNYMPLDNIMKCTKPLAADLTEYQKWALLMSAGLMSYDITTKKFESISPVGIADDGNGGYLIDAYYYHKAVIDSLKPTKKSQNNHPNDNQHV